MAKQPSKKYQLREAKEFIRETSRHLKKGRVTDAVRARFLEELNSLRQAVADKDLARVDAAREALDNLVDKHLEVTTKGAFREYVESIGLAVLVALILRGFVVEAFKIPTGSMIPTLLVGDHLFVNKFIYGIRVPFTETYVVDFATPEAGEVIVFTFPRDSAKAHLATRPAVKRSCIDRDSLENEKDFIKRIVGTPGDTIQIRKGRLMLNGQEVPRQLLSSERTGDFLSPKLIQEHETNNGTKYTIQYSMASADFGPVKVKEGHVFVMGDHRDNSADSRCWGQVPVENIKGRAIIIWMSWIKEEDELNPDEPDYIRWERLGRFIR